MFTPQSTGSSGSETKLLFNPYGDQYFRSQIWTEPNREVCQSSKCRMAQGLMAHAPKAQLVALVVSEQAGIRYQG
jgi:hypothetical protein